jgi:hypothetical protein
MTNDPGILYFAAILLLAMVGVLLVSHAVPRAQRSGPILLAMVVNHIGVPVLFWATGLCVARLHLDLMTPGVFIVINSIVLMAMIWWAIYFLHTDLVPRLMGRSLRHGAW